jgi:hypothetical protein
VGEYTTERRIFVVLDPKKTKKEQWSACEQPAASKNWTVTGHASLMHGRMRSQPNQKRGLQRRILEERKGAELAALLLLRANVSTSKSKSKAYGWWADKRQETRDETGAGCTRLDELDGIVFPPMSL